MKKFLEKNIELIKLLLAVICLIAICIWHFNYADKPNNTSNNSDALTKSVESQVWNCSKKKALEDYVETPENHYTETKWAEEYFAQFGKLA